jgi:SNF2 family DNA or RNA helicase
MSSSAFSPSTRNISLTREGVAFRLVLSPPLPEVIARIKPLPYASFDGESASWTVQVCAQSVSALRQWYREGLTDVLVDTLLAPGEVPVVAANAVLRPGTSGRPFRVSMATRDDQVYARLRAIPGSSWNKNSSSISYPPQGAAALMELVSAGVIDDPEKLLVGADVSISFDARTGLFVLRGDERAQRSFDMHYPANDVVRVWKDRDIDIKFTDDFSREVYNGELARAHPGLPPEGMNVTLYPFQTQSVNVALARTGFGVFHDLGLGKTVIAIAVAHELMFNRGEIPRSVIVVPGSVRSQWEDEINRFSHGEVVVIDGTPKKRKALYEAAANAPWLIVNYDLAHRDLSYLTPLTSGALLVADEVHRIKNPEAQRTKALRSLATRSSRRLGLSGTPVQNDPGEWLSVVSGFLVPGAFGNPKEFLNRYSYPGTFGGWEGARNLDELRQRSSTYYIRYTKPEVAQHLPPLRVQTRTLDVDPAYRNALARAHREARAEIKAAALAVAKKSGRVGHALDGTDVDEIALGAEMTAVGMLRQLCSSPRIVEASDSPSAKALVEAGLLPDSDGPKVDELRSMAAELQAEGQRVVIFTFSKRLAYLISERFTADGIRHVTFTGDTSSTDRDAARLAFNAPPTEDNPGPTAFVATDAGGEGLNLGGYCSLLINVDVPWTPGVLSQRSSRIHRIDGTAEKYLVINFTLRGTIEEGILRMIERKADLQDSIFGESGGRSRTIGRRTRSYVEEALDSLDKED